MDKQELLELIELVPESAGLSIISMIWCEIIITFIKGILKR